MFHNFRSNILIISFYSFFCFLFFTKKNYAFTDSIKKKAISNLSLGLGYLNFNFDHIEEANQKNKFYTIINSAFIEKSFILNDFIITPGFIFGFGLFEEGDYILFSPYSKNEYKIDYSLFNDFIKKFFIHINVKGNSSGVKNNIFGGLDVVSLTLGPGFQGLSPLLLLDNEILWKLDLSYIPFSIGRTGYDGEFHNLKKDSFYTSSKGFDVDFKVQYLNPKSTLNWGLYISYSQVNLVDEDRSNKAKILLTGLSATW